MLGVFAKIKGPVAGFGKIKLSFSKSFDKLPPEAQMNVLQQVMVQCREAHKSAEWKHKAKRAHEDARNAETIQARPEQVQQGGAVA